jgi:DNA-binding transcriptional MerR regulator
MEIVDAVLTSEAARILNVSPQTVRIWERIGRLRAVKAAKGVRVFDRRDVDRLARERLELANSKRELAEAH